MNIMMNQISRPTPWAARAVGASEAISTPSAEKANTATTKATATPPIETGATTP